MKTNYIRKPRTQSVSPRFIPVGFTREDLIRIAERIDAGEIPHSIFDWKRAKQSKPSKRNT